MLPGYDSGSYTHAQTRTHGFPTCAFLPAGLFDGKAFFFFNHFAPSFCNILQQTKHPLLGMFSICFMLILIKEFETEQTVPSRWPYKCEISKLFYLPRTLLVNFFKLIPASESLLIPRRELSNPSLQIFAFVTAPADRTGGVCLCSTPRHSSPRPISGSPLTQFIRPQ